MPKDPARKLDPRKLARQIADSRIADLGEWGNIAHPGDYDWAPDSDAWDELVSAILAKTAGLTEQQNALIDFIDDIRADNASRGVPAVVCERKMGIVWGIADAHAEAGFLVGLELGRRLGGAR
jgi:hypothetical protein